MSLFPKKKKKKWGIPLRDRLLTLKLTQTMTFSAAEHKRRYFEEYL